jgi:hypothetical protein
METRILCSSLSCCQLPSETTVSTRDFGSKVASFSVILTQIWVENTDMIKRDMVQMSLSEVDTCSSLSVQVAGPYSHGGSIASVWI